jgi:hypothetical protein
MSAPISALSKSGRSPALATTTGAIRKGSVAGVGVMKAAASAAIAGAAGSSDGTNIQVAVRCRPINAEEKKSRTPTVVTCDMEKAVLKIASLQGVGTKVVPARQFHFDKVFGMYSRQDEIFDLMIKPVVDEAMDGFTCAVFAYGELVEWRELCYNLLGLPYIRVVRKDVNCMQTGRVRPSKIQVFLLMYLPCMSIVLIVFCRSHWNG